MQGRHMKWALAVAAVAATLAAILLGGCESSDGVGASSDAAADSTVADCTATGLSCVLGDECCSGYCDELYGVCGREPGSCVEAGGECHFGTECCSFSCVEARCSATQCVSDSEPCEGDGQCCSGRCDQGSCQPLNPDCRTSGNSCGADADCCSGFCLEGRCDPAPSFCTQSGDACTADFECCGGLCDVASGATLGTCALVPAGGAGGCLSAGEVCGGLYDGGELPTCGGECCSRACQPFGPTGMLICQPPSGCRPTGELCASDADCCGSEGSPDGDTAQVTCSKEGDNPLGRCDAGNACTPAGGICRLQSISCNANANCCAGNVLQHDTCKLDSLGIPRCLIAEIDCTDPSEYLGQPCATSADCCGLPCTEVGDGELPTLVCGEGCVGSGGSCTTTADCCQGLPCVIPAGSTQGTCGDEPTCSSYGQECTIDDDCCNSMRCIDGLCGQIVQ